MKILTTILEDEKKEIQNTFERLNSLNSMIGTLADANLNISEQNWFYEKLIKDSIETRRNYSNWWISICEKYNLDKELSNSYFVDFINNQIMLNDEN